jgi:hypothetical protein
VTLRKITEGRRRRSEILLVGGTSRRVTKTNSLSRHFSMPRLSLRPASVSGSIARSRTRRRSRSRWQARSVLSARFASRLPMARDVESRLQFLDAGGKKPDLLHLRENQRDKLLAGERIERLWSHPEPESAHDSGVNPAAAVIQKAPTRERCCSEWDWQRLPGLASTGPGREATVWWRANSRPCTTSIPNGFMQADIPFLEGI